MVIRSYLQFPQYNYLVDFCLRFADDFELSWDDWQPEEFRRTTENHGAHNSSYTTMGGGRYGDAPHATTTGTQSMGAGGDPYYSGAHASAATTSTAGPIMNAMVVPHGTYEICTRTSRDHMMTGNATSSASATSASTNISHDDQIKWVMNINWVMKGLG